MAVSSKSDTRDLERTSRSIGPGAWAVEAERPIATLLGSCVAVCLWDPVLKIGGMNHFMLPRMSAGRDRNDFDVLLCGDYAMEALVNAMIAGGARRNRLQAKAFGGGAVVAGLTHTRIGEQNVTFTRDWLARECIPLIAADFLGRWSRKIILNPTTGDAFCRRGEEVSSSLIQAEERYGRTLEKPHKSNIELF